MGVACCCCLDFWIACLPLISYSLCPLRAALQGWILARTLNVCLANLGKAKGTLTTISNEAGYCVFVMAGWLDGGAQLMFPPPSAACREESNSPRGAAAPWLHGVRHRHYHQTTLTLNNYRINQSTYTNIQARRCCPPSLHTPTQTLSR